MNLRLENRPLKIRKGFDHAFTNDQAKVSVPKNSLLLPIFEARSDIQIGWLLEGPIGMTADLLVHSKGGAVGKIVNKSYSHMLIMPAKLDFIDNAKVKELNSLEDTTKYATIIGKFNLRITNIDFVFESRDKTFLWCHDPFSMWLVAEKGTIQIELPEIIGRTSDQKFFWVSKKGITVVNEKGKSFNTSDLFSGKTVREFVGNLLGRMNVDNLLRNFRDIKYSTRY